MKKSSQYILLAASLACWGCGDFLEETSLTLLRPSTVDDLEQILVGEVYSPQSTFFYEVSYDEFFQTDNVELYVQSYQELPDNYLNMYLWRPDMYTANVYEGAAELKWSVPYERILGCNVVLDYLDEMEGFADKREYLRGEALGLRGWIYFQLVNRFCVAYNQCDDPATEPGVPLKLESSVGVEYLSRSTVKEVYDRIEADLLESNRLLCEYEEQWPGNWRVGHLAVKAMLSRLYLYEEKWDEAIAWADSVLAVNHYLADFPIASGDDLYSSEECIWGNSCASSNAFCRISDNYLTAYSTTRDSLNNAAAAARIPDLRALLMKNGVMAFSRFAKEGIRTAELYLNRAEAYIHKFLDGGDESDKEAALDTLRELRKHRLNTEYAGEQELPDIPEEEEEEGKNLLEFCIDERWRELGGEINHRWCDVRRYGHTLTHTWEKDNLNATQDMSRYAQPIPEKVYDNNPAL